MIPIRVRCHGPLNDFLARSRRYSRIDASVAPRTSLKDAIEALGPPHPEIDRVVVNGSLAAITDLVTTPCSIDVYPFAEPLPLPGGRARFILDTHLGTLARDLRLLGFDSWYDNYADDATLASMSATDDRLLLTRDVGLLKRGIVTRGYVVRSTDLDHQLREIVRRYALCSVARPFSRCLRCNTPVERVEKEAIAHHLPPRTRETQSEFHRCPNCQRVYWPGTHYQRMVERIEGIAQ